MSKTDFESLSKTQMQPSECRKQPEGRRGGRARDFMEWRVVVMKAKMLNQVVRWGDFGETEREKRRARVEDNWITTYITDLPIETDTYTADERIRRFLEMRMKSAWEHRVSYELERNIASGFWHFTIVTDIEVDIPEADDEPEDNRKKG